MKKFGCILKGGGIILGVLCTLEVYAQQNAGEYSLSDCIQYALDNNITVKVSELTLKSAENTLSQSRQERLPNLTGSASQNLSNGNSIDPITSDFVSQRIHSTSFGLSSSLTLYNGNKINNQIKQNKLLTDQKGFLLEESKNNIRLQVLEAYIQTAYAKEAVKIAENNLEKSKTQLSQTEGLFRAKTVTIKDLSDAQSQAASAEYDLINAKKSFEQQKLILKQLLELPPDRQFNIAGVDGLDKNAGVLPDKLSIYQSALKNMPEIQAQELGQESAAYDRLIARSGYLPTLSLTGSLGTGYTNTQNYSFSDQMEGNFNQRVGLSLQIPIYDKGKTRLSVKNALISSENAALTMQQLEKTLYQKIETVWLSASVAQEQKNAAQSARDAAKTALDAAEANFTAGNSTATDLIIARTAYNNAEQNYLQIKYLAFLYQQQLQFYQQGTI